MNSYRMHGEELEPHLRQLAQAPFDRVQALLSRLQAGQPPGPGDLNAVMAALGQHRDMLQSLVALTRAHRASS